VPECITGTRRGVPQMLRALSARLGTNLKTETEWEATTQFVLGTRAYSAHIRSHVNATGSHPIVHSYTNVSKLFAQVRTAALEIIPEVIAENRR
jgi:hypothetical protein